MGQNVRIIRRSIGGIGEVVVADGSAEGPGSVAGDEMHATSRRNPSAASRMKSFEIFNPETDDLDSDDEASDVDDEEIEPRERREGDDDSDDSDDSESNDDSVESVVSVVSLLTDKTEQPQEQGCCHSVLS